MCKIVVTGSLAFDFIMNFPGKFADNIMPDKIHQLNLSFLAEKLNKNFGGTAGNIAYNLALTGNKPVILSSAGKDFDPYAGFLTRAGVDCSGICVLKNEFTSNYFVVVDKSDNQIGGFYAGAMTNDTKLSLPDKLLKTTKMVIISPTQPKAMLKFAGQCRKKKIPYMFDPGMQLPRLTDKQLVEGVLGAKILIGNDYEIALIQKRLRLSARQLLSKVNILITTLGEKGSEILSGAETAYRIKAAKPKCICDPVGAGDAYRAGFIAGLMRGFDLDLCGMMGATCAVYTVEQYGTTTHRFTKQQFCDRLYKNFGKKIAL